MLFVVGYFVLSTLFKNYIELPRNIKALEEKISVLERQNAQEHSVLLSRIQSIENGKAIKSDNANKPNEK